MTIRAVMWIMVALAVLALPFIVLLTGERAPGRSFLWDFSMGLGFGGLAVAGLQFVLTARFRRMTHPFGIDIVYLFHRYVAMGATGLMLAHFGILYIWFHDALGVLNPLEARWELTAGRLALGCFLALVVTSQLRKWLRLEYGLWRYLHVGLSVIGIFAAIAHILGVGHYTGPADKRALWLGVTLAGVALLVWVRLVKPWLQLRNPWRVVDNVAHRGGVHSLVLAPQTKGLTRWKPGQFVWLTLGHSPFALREHPFTISNAPEQGPEVTLSIKPLGDFTEKVIETEPGAIAHLDGPYGAFSIDNEPDAKGFVMVAGGIGVTPMIANLHALRERGDRRPVYLFYANPDWDEVTFRDELAEMEKAMNLHVVHVIQEPPEGWQGESGVVDRDVLERHLPTESRDYPHFLCGPAPMTDAVKSALRDLGVPLSRIDSEIFDMV